MSKIGYDESATAPSKAGLPRICPWTAQAQARDRTRSALAGVWLLPGRQAATDGHRLHLRPDPTLTAPLAALICPKGAPPQDAVPPWGNDVDRIIPAGEGAEIDGRALQRVLRAAVAATRTRDRRPIAVVISTSPEDAHLRVEGLRQGAAIPDRYGKVPKVLADRRYAPPEVVQLDGESTVRCTPGALGAVRLGLNARYLLDALGGRPRSVRWAHTHATGPVKVVHPDGRTAVIMPICL